jgi:DNA replication and repair protein RecF
METLASFNKALGQRNALLKQINERSSDPDQLAFWDEKITQAGAYLVHARIRAIQELERLATSTHLELTRGEEVLRIQYRPSYDPLSSPPGQIELPIDSALDRSAIELKEIQEGYREELLALRKEDIQRGVTSSGPHRDEIRFLSNGVDLGGFGSRGQLRTSLLSLKLAEVNWLKDKNGDWPVLLLDEVLAELDDTRRQDLLDRLAKTEQSLLTTTDLDLFSENFQESAGRWQILNGEVID